MPAPGPLVSVVIATRNRAALLPASARSVLAQSAADLELILVDDASDDATPEAMAALAAADPRVRILRLPRRAGLAGARNRGIEGARGEYVAFNDDDDLWLPDKLERQLAGFRVCPEAALVYSPMIVVGTDGRERRVGANARDGHAALRRLLRGNFIGVPCVLVRREALVCAGCFDEELPALEDWDLWIRLAAAGGLHHVPGPVARVFRTPGSLLSRRPAMASACERLLERAAAALPTPGRVARADLHEAVAHEQILRGSARRGRAALRLALRLDPAPRRLLKAAAAHLGRGAYLLGIRLWEASVSPGSAPRPARGTVRGIAPRSARS